LLAIWRDQSNPFDTSGGVTHAAEMPAAVPKLHRQMLKKLSGFNPEEQPPSIVPLDYPHADLRLYVTSKVERKSRAFSCGKESWTIEWLERHAAQGDVVYDVGANVGAYTLVAAHLVGAAGTVVAFEPGYASFAHLCDNIVLNGFAKTVVPIPLPLSGSTRLSEFTYHRLYPGHARHATTDAPRDPEADAPVYEQRALLTTLDDLVRTFRLPQPKLLKVDVDGTELDVLRGARDLLAHRDLQHVLMEIEVENSDGVIAALADAGLSLDARHQRRYEDDTPALYWYGLFSRH
jgi:FkbM family methyltransferase